MIAPTGQIRPKHSSRIIADTRISIKMIHAMDAGGNFKDGMLKKERGYMSKLREAAKAVVDRWDSPEWSDGTYIPEYIRRLSKAIEEEQIITEQSTAYSMPDTPDKEYTIKEMLLRIAELEAEETKHYEPAPVTLSDDEIIEWYEMNYAVLISEYEKAQIIELFRAVIKKAQEMK